MTNHTPLLDLKAQYREIREEIQKAVMGVLEGGRYILGPEVKSLEEEVAAYSGTRYGIGVANGTDALLLTLDAWGIGPGDEVITTPFTFFATAEVISKLGARPVFVDIDPETCNLDVSLLENHVSEKTKAVIPVHIFGQPANLDEVTAFAEKHGLRVLEDAAQAIGAEYKGRRIGSFGDAATYSFFPTKNLGGYGDGGMVVTDDAQLAETLKSLRVHGRSPHSKYHNALIGYNSRLDELQAAALRVKLQYLDRWNEARRERARVYNRLLEGLPVTTPVEAEDRKHIYHLYIIQTEERDGLMEHLKSRGIGTAAYYPVPLHLQEVYRDLGYREGDLPVAEEICRRSMALPLYPELDEATQMRVVEAVKQFFDS
ncbi:dTDP-4-amino-4,6-dideoxygalactose transaminase [Melghirimyces profundicolus]|uniref:dTDP-4-amino-4,6-dideoxygalactose transaminase n=1 Tax=Melghirimyces profundicolus TaxID=1242148 RepID=A0A2T6C2J5_9BACL|nr:DegT/DnrJ/EryC1/StrS family aminotransferase [Melghirimyces profundicolus]PTX62546.1 dTDP-4-amino-4,6-dideoxygalactose transaminase [Melghirimyces profundicolus]